VFTWIIGATGDKLSWVWYIIAMSVISIIGTIAVSVPAEWTTRRTSDGVGALVGASR
jgi:hypothetical protein